MDISELIKEAILEAIYIKKPPGEGYPPRYLTEEALKLWPEFWEKYGKKVIVESISDKGEIDPDKAWTVAVAIFKNFSKKRGVQPFPDKDKKTTEVNSNSLLEYIILSSKENGLPDNDYPPAYSTEEALKLWPYFWEKYREDILKQSKGDPKKTWAATVAIFRNHCLKRNVIPFEHAEVKEGDVSPHSETKDYMVNRFISNRKKLTSANAVIIKSLIRGGVVKSVEKEKMYKVSYSENRKIFDFVSIIQLNLTDDYSNIESRIKGILVNKNFEKEKHFVRTDGNTDIILYEDKTKDDKMNLYNVMHYTPAHVKLIIGDDKNTANTMEKLTTIASHAFKDLLKKTVSNVDMIGNILDTQYIDFSSPLTEEEKNGIKDNIRGINKYTANTFINTYTLDYIRNLGTPVFQFYLVKALIHSFKLMNLKPYVFWYDIVNDPDTYLNPSIYLEQEDEENQLEG